MGRGLWPGFWWSPKKASATCSLWPLCWTTLLYMVAGASEGWDERERGGEDGVILLAERVVLWLPQEG